LKHCAYCDAPLVQRPNEQDQHWEKRRHCGVRCAVQGRNREQGRISDEELVAVWQIAGTLQATGEIVGLSRERVRQRLKRQGFFSDAERGPRTLSREHRCAYCGEVFYHVLPDQAHCSSKCAARAKQIPDSRILEALAQTGGHQGKASALLGMHPVSLCRRLREMKER
jgi:DNA-binding protein Fis